MALRVVAWPMGYIILAKGARAMFFWTEVAATVVHVGLAFVSGPTVRPSRRDHGVFRAVRLARRADLRDRPPSDRFPVVGGQPRLGLLFLPLIGLVFCGFFAVSFWLATAIGLSPHRAAYIAADAVRLVSLERDLPRCGRLADCMSAGTPE